jgi:hypothetical protein
LAGVGCAAESGGDIVGMRESRLLIGLMWVLSVEMLVIKVKKSGSDEREVVAIPKS